MRLNDAGDDALSTRLPICLEAQCNCNCPANKDLWAIQDFLYLRSRRHPLLQCRAISCVEDRERGEGEGMLRKTTAVAWKCTATGGRVSEVVAAGTAIS